MNTKRIFIIILTIFYIALCLFPCYAAETRDSDAELFLRLHIRANSDSKEDQDLKLKVRDAVLKYTSELLADTNEKSDAVKAVSEKLQEIELIAEKIIKESGFSYNAEAEIKKEYFERREYESFFLPADVYDSLIIKLGKGEGHNWWCVIFPAVCISGSIKTNTENPEESITIFNTEKIPEKYRLNLAENPTPQKVKYEFWIVNFIKSIIDLFNK